MKPSRSQFYFLGSIFFLIGLLQVVMLWFLSASDSLFCNAGGAWPFSALPYLGSSILTLIFTLGITVWAWNTLAREEPPKQWWQSKAWFWGLIVASGLSHALERFSSACVLDYWHISFFNQTIYFNLGDIFITAGVILISTLWIWDYKSKTL